jgi:hypothetical protein
MKPGCRNGFDDTGVLKIRRLALGNGSIGEITAAIVVLAYGVVANKPRRKYCGTPSRRFREYDPKRHDPVPEFWVTEPFMAAKLKIGSQTLS